MQEFIESDLIFRFPADWIIRKYDDTVAYQSLSGHGLKGVDFLALSPDGYLWLIEVKNYRPRLSSKNGKEYYAKRRTPQELADHVGRKFTDTRRLIMIVDTYFRRKWLSRFRLWIYKYFPHPRAGSNLWFWTTTRKWMEDGKRVVLVLWMETPEKNDDYTDATARKLVNLIPADTKLYVTESEQAHALPFYTLSL